MREGSLKRRRRQQQAGGAQVRQLPWARVRSALAPVELLSADQVEAVHRTSLRILRDVGMEVLSDRALDVFAEAGADVDRSEKRVRMDPAFVEEKILTAPAEFTIHARNPERDVLIGANSLNFCNATTPPFTMCLDKGRRPGIFEDFENLLRLMQSLNIVHFLYGYPVEPQDIPPETRHLDCYRSFVTLTDKVWRTYSSDPRQVDDALEMVRMARGVTTEDLAEQPSLMLNVNTNSPLRLDGPLSDGLLKMSAMGQPVVISAFTMAGAMAPVTMAGALTQQNAEVLAGMVLTQLVRPGAPVIYGAFTSNVHLRSGSLALGTPEYFQAALASGQMARRYGVPLKSSNVNSSNAVDAQAAYESGNAIWGAVLSHVNVMAHGVGWLESGLSCSFEKMILDAEMLQMAARAVQPLEVDDDTMGFDAIAEVGPGGHFFDTSHTLERYETAFYEPMLSDWSNFETWEEKGGKTATDRANGIWKRLLGAYAPPPLDPAVSDQLTDYVERRRRDFSGT